MQVFRHSSRALAALVIAAFAQGGAMAAGAEAQLNGAWAESDENCQRAFVRKGGSWQFRAPRDMFGSSYIISGRRYEGPFGECNLAKIAPKGDKLLLSLSCHNTIGYSDQVTPIQLTSPTEMVVFSMDGMSINYKKCGQ